MTDTARRNRPRCSIGLPVWNGMNYVEEAIRSVLAQDMGDFELIISDNASTDRTAEICERFALEDDRIVYVRHPRNIGAAKNYNHVFHLAQGEYFVWLAHDDVQGPRFLSTCLEAFDRADPDTVLVYPAFTYIDDASREIGQDEPRCVETSAGSPAQRLFDVLEGLGIVSSIFGMFRRERLARTRLIGSYVASDYVLLAECALLGKIVRIDGPPQFERRLHDEGSQRANKTSEEIARWFDPNARLDLKPSQRLSREYLLSILSVPDLSAGDRIMAVIRLVIHRVLLKRRARRLRRAGPRRLAIDRRRA